MNNSKKLKPILLKKGVLAAMLGASLTLSTVYVSPVEPTKVEAANKDKKKPKITFKGKSKLTVEEEETITINKTTYSDNLKKKKKLKLREKKKKRKKNYKTIANTIKKATLNNKTASVEFPEDGTYKINYTVTDLAKNVATKSRTVIVSDKEIITEEQIITKEDPTTEITITTEEPKREVVTTEATTEQTKTEEPKTEEPKPYEKTEEEKNMVDLTDKEYKDYGYKVLGKDETAPFDLSSDNETEDASISFEYDYRYLCIDRYSDTFKNLDFIKYLGKITATDKDGNDISNSIVIKVQGDIDSSINNIYVNGIDINIFAKTTDGKNVKRNIYVNFVDCSDLNDFNYLIITNIKVYGRVNEFSFNNERNTDKVYKLCLDYKKEDLA